MKTHHSISHQVAWCLRVERKQEIFEEIITRQIFPLKPSPIYTPKRRSKKKRSRKISMPKSQLKKIP